MPHFEKTDKLEAIKMKMRGTTKEINETQNSFLNFGFSSFKSPGSMLPRIPMKTTVKTKIIQMRQASQTGHKILLVALERRDYTSKLRKSVPLCDNIFMEKYYCI